MFYLTHFYLLLYGKKEEGNVLFNDTLNIFYLTTHSTYFIYSYMASDIW